MRFEYNDGGRSKYFRATDVGDCVTRAICNATGLDYLFVYKRLKELAKGEKTTNHRGGKRSSVRDGVFKETWKEFLEEINWKRVKTMEMGGRERVHLADGELPSSGTMIVQVSRHLTCVRDGVLVDTYDCSRDGDRMVYGYYIPMTDDEVATKNAKAEAARVAAQRAAEDKAAALAERKAQAAKAKKIKDRYKKKMSPWLKKIRALEKQMNKELEALTMAS